MNITELRYLVAIMQWGSVNAAAKQLYAAQPNISKALKNLEEEYHIRIFERSSTGMIPTEQGRRFIEQAERVRKGWFPRNPKRHYSFEDTKESDR